MKAETLYRYLTDNVDYEEEHTGLEDSLIELEILLTALALLGQSDGKGYTMKVTFYRKDEINIDLEWMAQKLVSLIRFNLKHRIEDPIQDLVVVCLEDGCSRYLLDDFEL